MTNLEHVERDFDMAMNRIHELATGDDYLKVNCLLDDADMLREVLRNVHKVLAEIADLVQVALGD